MWYLFNVEDSSYCYCAVFTSEQALLKYMEENNLSFDEYDYVYRL